MVQLYLVPRWFFGFDIAMELIFAVVAMVLASFAYKIYKASEEEEVRLFSVSFALISVSYIVWAAANYFIMRTLTGDIFELNLTNLLSTSYILSLLHMSLFILGLITLTYATLGLKNGRIYYLFAGLGLIGLVSSSIPWITYQILSIVLIASIIYHQTVDHSCYKNKKSMCISLAFILLFLSRLDFLFAAKTTFAYILGHILELSAYLIILNSLMQSIKGWKK